MVGSVKAKSIPEAWRGFCRRSHYLFRRLPLTVPTTTDEERFVTIGVDALGGFWL
jgi:hypothetical protein